MIYFSLWHKHVEFELQCCFFLHRNTSERIYSTTKKTFKIDLRANYTNKIITILITAITQYSIDDGMALFLIAHSIGENCSQFKNKILVRDSIAFHPFTISIYLVQFSNWLITWVLFIIRQQFKLWFTN